MPNRLERLWRWAWIVPVLSVVTIIMLLFLLNVALQGRATAEDQKALQERQDCARAIGNEQGAAINDLTIAKARLDERYIEAQLIVREDRTQVDALAEELATLARDLDAKIDAVDALPPTQQLVESRCPGIT